MWESYGWRSFGRASQHFARGSDPKQFAEALFSCSKLAPSDEADLFICRAVLQVVCGPEINNVPRTLHIP